MTRIMYTIVANFRNNPKTDQDELYDFTKSNYKGSDLPLPDVEVRTKSNRPSSATRRRIHLAKLQLQASGGPTAQ